MTSELKLVQPNVENPIRVKRGRERERGRSNTSTSLGFKTGGKGYKKDGCFPQRVARILIKLGTK